MFLKRVNIEWPINSDFHYPSAFSTGLIYFFFNIKNFLFIKLFLFIYVGNQHSSRLLSMNKANGLVKLPGKTNSKTSIKKGEILTALIIEKI
jgi:hypothetical protein